MRLHSSVLCAAVAVLTGCAANSSGPADGMPNPADAQSHFINGRFIPHWSALANLIPVELQPRLGPAAVLARIVPDKYREGGIYVSEYGGAVVLGYHNPNTKNKPPICSVSSGLPNSIAVDRVYGDLIVPDSAGHVVTVYNGPGMCGSELGSISDPYGDPGDAASTDARHGDIIVGNTFDNSGAAGSVSVCTLSAGCFENVTNPNMYEVVGVALDKNGDCWVSGTDASGVANLTYFPYCTGGGYTATGYLNSYYGGLDIDNAGNLVSISSFDAELYVYKGCNPACTLVGGPFPLYNDSNFGHLDKRSKHFVAADFALGQVDVYSYSPKSLTYRYSFSNGLSPSLTVQGAAFNPSSKE